MRSSGPRRPKALLFDLDGTLVDSEGDIADACNAALVEQGLGPLGEAVIRRFIGDGARLLVARALEHALAAPPDELTVDATLAAFGAAYAKRPCARTTVLPGVEAALTTGLPNAVVTNKPGDIARLVLERLGLASRFVAVVGGGDAALKPAPDGVLAALAAVGVAAEDAWMIGDGPQDVEAGRRAGCVTVAVPGIAERARVLAARPDHVAPDMTAVAALALRALDA